MVNGLVLDNKHSRSHNLMKNDSFHENTKSWGFFGHYSHHYTVI